MINTLSAYLRHFQKPQIYIVSYPKTGRTWLRVMLGKYLSQQYSLPEQDLTKINYLTVSAGLPKTKFTHDKSALSANSSYTELDPNKSRYRNKKIFLLTRNVKDTVVSAYFQATKRRNLYEGTISDFVRHERFGAKRFLLFYKQWHARAIPKDFAFLSYEDMHKDPSGALEMCLRFIGFTKVDSEMIRAAVNYGSFENLKKLERKTKIVSGEKDDQESYKARKGKAGNYTEYLDQKDIEYIDALLLELGCEFTN